MGTAYLGSNEGEVTATHPNTRGIYIWERRWQGDTTEHDGSGCKTKTTVVRGLSTHRTYEIGTYKVHILIGAGNFSSIFFFPFSSGLLRLAEDILYLAPTYLSGQVRGPGGWEDCFLMMFCLMYMRMQAWKIPPLPTEHADRPS